MNNEGEVANIWEEGEDTPQNITYEENKEQTLDNIADISLNKIIEKITLPGEIGLFILYLNNNI